MTEIDKLLEIMKKIREKCPWDAKQTHKSLKRYLVEETYETLDSIDANDVIHLKSELGDLLLQIVFHSQIASENNTFSFRDVVNTISEKMIERHPHVFQNNAAISAEEVQNNWEKIKHKSENRSSLLGTIPVHLPALLKAQRLQEKASSVGFDWTKAEDVIMKLEEEIEEFKQAINHKNMSESQNELGDILFTLVNIARFIDITAEEALQKTNNKFISRFNHIENHYSNNPDKISQASIDELDAIWEKAKESE
jgi:tetrapyrrole methylase family protein / MazG family protein